jgi:hypothetical protein
MHSDLETQPATPSFVVATVAEESVPDQNVERFLLVDSLNPERTIRHGQPIPAEFMHDLLGQEAIDLIAQQLEHGNGEAMYLKGGKLSLLINHSYLDPHADIPPGEVGDNDLLVCGNKTVARVRAWSQTSEKRNVIGNAKTSTGQELEFVDGEKQYKDIAEATVDALDQILAYEEQHGGLNQLQYQAREHALGILEELVQDPESVLLSKGIARSKESAIKITKDTGGELVYTFCEPQGSLRDQTVFLRARLLDETFALLTGDRQKIVYEHTLPNISDYSIHRLVMEMVVAFGHFETESDIVRSTVPVVGSLMQLDIKEGMVFAGDGLRSEQDPEEIDNRHISRALPSVRLMRQFFAEIVRSPRFADIPDERIAVLEGDKTFGDYNKRVLQQQLFEACQSEVVTAGYYIFSYYPALGRLLFPAIDALPALSEYHRTMDATVQCSLRGRLECGMLPSELERQRRALAFFQNFSAICDAVYPEKLKPIFPGSPNTSPLIWQQDIPTENMSRVVAILLYSAGQRNPSLALLESIAANWPKNTEVAAKEGSFDTNVTKESLIEALSWLAAADLPPLQ